MTLLGIGLLLGIAVTWGVSGEEISSRQSDNCPGNSTDCHSELITASPCHLSNTNSSDLTCDDVGSSAQPTHQPPTTDCQQNGTCPLDQPTSRLLPGVLISGNATASSTAVLSNFSPSQFLGAIPDRAYAVGEVFHDVIGPVHRRPFSFPHQPSPTQSVQTHNSPPQHQVSLGSYGRPDIPLYPRPTLSGSNLYPRPPVVGYLGSAEATSSTSNRIYDHTTQPQVVEIQLNNYERREPTRTSLVQSKQGSRLDGLQISVTGGKEGSRYDGADYSQGGGQGYEPELGLNYDHSEDPNSLEGHKLKQQPLYEAYENMKDLLKPIKILSFPETKPIKEETDDLPKFPYPLVGTTHLPESTPDSFNKFIEPKKRSSKWKGALKLLATLLPFGLLVAALSPNILVVNSNEDPNQGSNPLVTSGIRQRSLDGLGPCAVQKFCQTLSTSKEDFKEFVEATKGRLPEELNDLLKKAESGNCTSLPCSQ